MHASMLLAKQQLLHSVYLHQPMENLPGDEELAMSMFEGEYVSRSFECCEISSNVCSVFFCLVFVQREEE